MSKLKEIKKEDYWECGRCKITSSTKDRMCPCPRGSCEAEVIGEIIITREFVLFNDKVKR